MSMILLAQSGTYTPGQPIESIEGWEWEITDRSVILFCDGVIVYLFNLCPVPIGTEYHPAIYRYRDKLQLYVNRGTGTGQPELELTVEEIRKMIDENPELKSIQVLHKMRR